MANRSNSQDRPSIFSILVPAVLVLGFGGWLAFEWYGKKREVPAKQTSSSLASPTASTTPPPATGTKGSGAANSPRFANFEELMRTPTPAARQAQREALTIFPQLGVAKSGMNVAFVAKCEWYLKNDPKIFLNDNWPLTIAYEVADGNERTFQRP